MRCSKRLLTDRISKLMRSAAHLSTLDHLSALDHRVITALWLSR
jgi:hypothetical protein